jgi:hypothetical protein
MANALSKLLNTTGPERTAWLERQLEPVKNALSAAAYYVPPELRQTGGQVANALAMMSPGADVMDAAQSSGDMMDAARRGDFMGVAGAGAGIAAAGLGMFVPGTAKGYGSAAEEVAGMLKSGRGADITDEMIAKADPAELFDLYGAGKTGMDMPMDEASRMARAQGMGFDTGTPLYHGTDADFAGFDTGRQGYRTEAASARAGTWATDSPRTAESYADFAATDAPVRDLIRASEAAEGRGAWDEAARLMEQAEALEEKLHRAPQNGQRILPVVMSEPSAHRGVYPSRMEADEQSFGEMDGRIKSAIDDARAEKTGGVDIFGLNDNADFSTFDPARHSVRFDPSNIRSRFARFDPRLKHLANLSAAGAGVIGYNALRDERDRNEQGGM